MANKINDSFSEITTGRRLDWRENTWSSVGVAEAAIKGKDRIKGQKIPIELSVGNVVDHHWINNRLVPYDGRVGLPDGVLVDGFSLNVDKTEVTLDGTSWRIHDITYILQNIWKFPVPAPDAGGLIRIDRIKLNSSGPVYMVGDPGISAVAKPLIYGEILLRDITVSLADITSDPEPQVTSDNQLHYVLAVPDASFGKVGDVAKIKQAGADYGKEYKKKTLSGVDTWELEYTPAAGGASSFADLTGDPYDNANLEAALDGLNDDIIAAQAAADIAQEDIENIETDLLPLKENKIEKDATGGYAGLTLLKINFKNALNTFTSFLANANTAARTYTFPDKDGTVAMLSDITGGSNLPVPIADTVSIPFTNMLTTVGDHTMSGALTIVPNTTGAISGCGAVQRIVANGINTPDLTAFKKLSTSGNYLNTYGKVNILIYYYDGTHYNVGIMQNGESGVIPTGGEVTAWETRLATAGYTIDSTRKAAYDIFISQLKSDGVYSLITEMWMFEGGTAATNILGFKGVKDLVVNGTITHSSTGSTGNGTTGYFNTNYSPVDIGFRDMHMCVYGANAGANSGYLIGSSATQYTYISPQGSLIYTGIGGVYLNPAHSGSKGRYIVSRLNGNYFVSKNGVQSSTTLTDVTDTNTNKMFICAMNEGGTTTSYSNQKISFVSVGKRLTTTQATAFDTALNNLILALGR